jgi:ATP-binding cassette subfamily D (ALD) protein 3
VDNQFFDTIKELIGIVVPNRNCKETKYLIILTLLLILRTYMSIWLAEINGKLVKSIIGKDFKKFLLKVSFIPITF